MRWILIFLLAFSLFGFVNAQTLTVTGETDLFSFTVEFKDSALIEDCVDTICTNKMELRIKTALNLVTAEFLVPDAFRLQAYLKNRHLLYNEISNFDKILDNMPVEEKDRPKIIRARNILA